LCNGPLYYYNRPVQNSSLSDPRRALVSIRALFGDILKFLSRRVFLVQMTFQFKIKNAIVFSIVSERKYELTVLNFKSKIISKPIFLHFYSLEGKGPFCGALIGGKLLFLRNIFILDF
jgi:hypothetical protein